MWIVPNSPLGAMNWAKYWIWCLRHLYFWSQSKKLKKFMVSFLNFIHLKCDSFCGTTHIVSAVCRGTKVMARAPKKKLKFMSLSDETQLWRGDLTLLLTHLWFTSLEVTNQSVCIVRPRQGSTNQCWPLLSCSTRDGVIITYL